MKYIFTFQLLSISLIANSQSPNWMWARAAGGINMDGPGGIVTDNSGNIYMAGYFLSPTITFGTTVLTNAGPANTSDIFMAKYDPAGNVLWAKRAGGARSDGAYCISADSQGDFYIAGGFSSQTMTIGSYTLTNTTLADTSDIFIAKFDSSGNIIWAINAGGNKNDGAAGICVDGGNLYATGTFESDTLVFGPDKLAKKGAFILKLDTGGNAIWARYGRGFNNGGTSISADGQGNVLVTGYFATGQIVFGSDTLKNPSAPSSDVFVVKYTGSGNEVWAVRAGGTQQDRAWEGVVDEGGNIYVTGDFLSPSLIFGNDTFQHSGLGADVFTVKYDSSGQLQWAKHGKGNNDDLGYGIDLDTAGNVFVTGFCFSHTLTFDTAVLTLTLVTGDLFIVQYDTAGNLLWADIEGGNSNDIYPRIHIDDNNNLYLAGRFGNACAPPCTLSFGSTILTSPGSDDIFLARMGSAATYATDMRIPDDIIIYPNPALQSITIRTAEPVLSIGFRNMLGERTAIPDLRKEGNGYKIPLPPGLKPGIYLLEIQTPVSREIKKVIIQ